MSYPISWARRWPDPADCNWKVRPIDFVVEELWQPPNSQADTSDAGEHTLLWVEKMEQNTQWVARQLARFAGVRDMDIGYHGLKDRAAVTRQWFSVYFGNRKVPDWSGFQSTGVKLLKLSKGPRKLRRGEHAGNRFRVTLSEINGDRQVIVEKLKLIFIEGYPNYFGHQRFGHDANNIKQVNEWFREGRRPRQRSTRSLLLSAARSFLFNQVLEARLLAGHWSTLIPGDVALPLWNSALVSSEEAVAIVDGPEKGGLAPDRLVTDCLANKGFANNGMANNGFANSSLANRGMVGQNPAVPSGPMLGGADFLEQEAGNIEKAALADYSDWLSALHKEGIRTSRRPLVALPANYHCFEDGQRLTLQFDLAPGCYASVLLEQAFRLNHSRSH